MAAEKRKPYITEATQADVKGSGANAENCQVQQVLDTETKVPRARLPTCPPHQSRHVADDKSDQEGRYALNEGRD